MRVFITTDLEGVAGVLLDRQVGLQDQGAEYDRARLLLTLEVNEAVEGALAGGATEVLVDDGHASGSNFVFEKLHPKARYVMGTARPGWLSGVEGRYDATFFVGCHAMAGTLGAVRDHTMSTTHWHNMWINGKLMGEIGFWAATAGHYGMRCVMMSGCEKACEEAAALVPGIETVATKRGLSRYSAVLEPAEKVREMIRAAAETAVGKAKSIEPYDVGKPVEIRVEYNITGQADSVKMVPGRERLDARTIAYRGANIVEAASML